MSLLDRVERRVAEKRAIEVPWRPWDSRYVPFNAGGPAHPSETLIGPEHALRLAPLYAGARLIADKVASLPLQQYRKLPTGKTMPLPTGSLFSKPASKGTIYDWLFQAMTSLVLQGNAIGLITARDGYGFPTSIEWLPMDRVDVVDDQDQPWNPHRSRIYFYGGELKWEQVFHIRAFTIPGRTLGLSPLRLFIELIQSGQDEVSYGASWFKSGGFPPGTFQNQEIEVDSEQADEIRRRLTQSIQRREPLVYGRDWDYKPVAVPPSEAQFIEAMQLNATQIAAILGIPPERIGGTRGDSLTYSTQEQESIALLTDTLQPWLVRLETAFFDALPQQQYVRFNTAAMLKTTTENRYQIYHLAREMGIQTANEIRELEEMEPLPGTIGDDPLPLEVLTAMARGIKEIPKSMESLVDVAPTDVAQMASGEKIAANNAQAAQAHAAQQQSDSDLGSSTADDSFSDDSADARSAAARAARQRWEEFHGKPDYRLHPSEIRALMNGARRH